MLIRLNLGSKADLCLERRVGRGGGGSRVGRGDSDIFIFNIVLAHFFVQHFKFQYIFWGFQKNENNFLGYEDFVAIFGVSSQN